MDKILEDALKKEKIIQEDNIELIASENYVSKDILILQGSILTNKYAEGYPKKRYYGGCENIDVFESTAIEYAKKLFGAKYANVQPHSGSSANMAVYRALLKPGDKVLAMNLQNGGHLTHGHKLSFSGIDYDIIDYDINKETEVIDYDALENLALKEKPKMIIAGASAYSRIIDYARFKRICEKTGAYLMVDMAHIAGLVAAGLHESPIPYAHVTTTTTHKTLRGPRGGMIMCSNEVNKKYNFNKAIFPGIQGGPLMHVIAGKAVCFKEALDPSFKLYAQGIIDNAQALASGLMNRGFELVSGGTDNHLMLVNLINKGVTGKQAEKMLDAANITCNKNTVPNDPQSAFTTSGIRLGTAAVTTRGFNTADMDVVAQAISLVIDDMEKNKEEAMALVKSLTDKYPLYE